MNLFNTKNRYGWLPLGLHWLMLLLIASLVACISLSDSFPKGSDKQMMLKTWHFTLGLSVFVLVWVRLAVKLMSATPVIDPPIPRWQALTANTVQALLYALMIGMPIVGWLVLSAAGKAIPFYGWQLPALIAENNDLAETLKGVHETGATTLFTLVGIHAAAALYHHYFVRDNTLRRMLP